MEQYKLGAAYHIDEETGATIKKLAAFRAQLEAEAMDDRRESRRQNLQKRGIKVAPKEEEIPKAVLEADFRTRLEKQYSAYVLRKQHEGKLEEALDFIHHDAEHCELLKKSAGMYKREKDAAASFFSLPATGSDFDLGAKSPQTQVSYKFPEQSPSTSPDKKKKTERRPIMPPYSDDACLPEVKWEADFISNQKVASMKKAFMAALKDYEAQALDTTELNKIKRLMLEQERKKNPHKGESDEQVLDAAVEGVVKKRMGVLDAARWERLTVDNMAGVVRLDPGAIVSAYYNAVKREIIPGCAQTEYDESYKQALEMLKKTPEIPFLEREKHTAPLLGQDKYFDPQEFNPFTHSKPMPVPNFDPHPGKIPDKKPGHAIQQKPH